MWVLEFKSLRWLSGVIEESFSCLYFYEFGKSSRNKFLQALWRAVGIACNDHWRCCEKNMNGDQSRLQSHLLFGFEGRCHTDHWATTTKRQGGWHICRHWRVSIASCDGSHWKYQCGSSARSESMISLYQLFIVFLDGREIKLDSELSYCCFIAMRVLIPSYRKDEGDGCGGIIF